MVERFQVVERSGLGLAIVHARKNVDRRQIGAVLDIDLSDGPGHVGDKQLAAIGIGPGAWFLVSEAADDDWAEKLAEKLDGLAAVFDQSSGYVVFRLTGPDARRVLQSGVAIDLDPAVFGPSCSASTALAHIGVLIWRSDADDSFHLALYRSYRECFEHWLWDAMASI